ncbi:SocA family protein [Burkholderia pyrrocinia]|nr:SocA family protein [Burkholderia pyrrocinia]
MFPHLYNARKASDATAYLMNQAGGVMRLAVLERLLYLAERESFKSSGLPLTGDNLVSFENGPALWHTHQRLVGEVADWRPWMSNLPDRFIAMRQRAVPEKLEHYFERHTVLSRADVNVLQSVWDDYGELPVPRLIEAVKIECKEWNPASDETTISYKQLFRALEFTPAEIEGVLMQLEEIDSLNQLTAESAA